MTLQKVLAFVQTEFGLRDRILLAPIFCSLVALIVGFSLLLIPGLQELGALTMVSAQAIAEWTGLIFFLIHSTIMQSNYWKYIIACLMIIFVSILFKILHYAGAMELLAAGFILLEIVYTIRFVNQRHTSTSGWIKYGWICSWCVGTLGLMLNKLPEIFMIIPAILFWLTLVFFLREKLQVAKKYTKI